MTVLGDDLVDDQCGCGEDHCLLLATGYPYCLRCQEHHRHPETCSGINEQGDEV